MVAGMVMERDFERFQGGANEAISKRLHVTISPAKLILLNRNLFNALGKPGAVFLCFSRVRDTIAIEPASARRPEAFPVVTTGVSWRINSAPFCRHFNIEVDTTLKFIKPEIVDGALYLKMNETISVGGRKRRKRKSLT